MDDPNTARQNGAERGNIPMDVAEMSVPRPAKRRGTEAASRTGRRSCLTSIAAGDRPALSRPRRPDRDRSGRSRSLCETRMQLISRFASGAVLAEELEARLVRGEQIDIADTPCSARPWFGLHSASGSTACQDVTPSLGDYLRDRLRLRRRRMTPTRPPPLLRRPFSIVWSTRSSGSMWFSARESSRS